ncbi:hypothetical protein BFW41_14890 [Aeromonas hydrophila]|nr:hypothetical protein BFW41_14890 [Aeromonas hydrophila]
MIILFVKEKQQEHLVFLRDVLYVSLTAWRAVEWSQISIRLIITLLRVFSAFIVAFLHYLKRQKRGRLRVMNDFV